MPWRVHERDGQIALTLGWFVANDEPYRVREWIVGNAKAEHWPGVIGECVKFTGNQGRVYDRQRRRWMIFDTDNETEWHRETDKERVRKPPKRKGEYDYEWRDGEWRKVWL